MADGVIRLPEITDPSSPPTDKHFLYVGADGTLRKKDDAGTVVNYDSALSYTDEDAQDAVGAALTDTANIDLSYNDGLNQISADLVNTGVSAATYGSASQVAQVAVDAKGRISSASNVAIAITSAQVTDFAEAAQDAVAPAFVDSASVDFTYNDGANSVSAAVLPAGVDHDALANFVANEHIDHSAVQIATAAGSGLQGGGDISATRNLSLNITGLTLMSEDVDPVVDEVLIYDVSAGAHRKVQPHELSKCNPDRFLRIESDFITSPTDGLTSTVSGTGASTQAGTYGIDATENAQGVTQSDTGTTATGRAALGSSSVTCLQNQASQVTNMRFATRMAPEALSVAGVEQYTVYAGLLDNTLAAGDVTDGAYFRYTDGVNSGKWEAVVAAGGVRAALDTGIVATVSYQIFEVILDSASAKFYIDGALVATHTTGLPVGSTQTFGYGWKIEKAAGLTQRNLSNDWFCFELERTAAR